MKRLSTALILAILIHGCFFLVVKLPVNPDEAAHPPQIRMVTMTLFQKEQAPSATPPVKPLKKNKPVENKITPPRAQQPVLPPPQKMPIVSEPEILPEAPPSSPEQEQASQPEPGKDIAYVDAINEATPLYKVNPPPRYPVSAIKRGYSGEVLLRVWVDINGQATDVRIFNSSGYPILDRAAQNAVKHWAFQPGRKGEKKLGMWVNVPVVFRLEDT